MVWGVIRDGLRGDTWRSKGWHMARKQTPEGEAVWWPCRVEEDSGIRGDHWSGRLKEAIDDDDEEELCILHWNAHEVCCRRFSEHLNRSPRQTWQQLTFLGRNWPSRVETDLAEASSAGRVHRQYCSLFSFDIFTGCHYQHNKYSNMQSIRTELFSWDRHWEKENSNQHNVRRHKS